MTTYTPGLRAELAWGSGFTTPEGSRVWTDATSDLRTSPDLSITRGRGDQQSAVQPSMAVAVFENNAGQYTPGKTSGANWPNVKRSVPIRYTQRDDSNLGAGNLLTANQASFETSFADWTVDALGTTQTLITGGTRSFHGSNSMRLNWPTTGSTVFGQTVMSGLVIGRTYTVSGYLYVSSSGGSPAVQLRVVGLASSPLTATVNQFERVSVSFVATASTHTLRVQAPTGATSGQQVWVDAIQLDEGTVLGTFTTTPPAIRVRGLFYVESWAISWPTGGSEQSFATVTAYSRKSRLGQSATLDSPIRAAYLADDPEVYWPMDEEAGVVDISGRQVFLDITNPLLLGRKATEFIGSFADTVALLPVVQDGTPGPTDEASLVKLPYTTDLANPDWLHYVGGSVVMKIGTNLAGIGARFEVVARVIPTNTGAVDVDVARLFANASSWNDEVRFNLFNNGTDRGISLWMVRRDSDGNTVESPGWFWATTHEANQAAYDSATDGEIHHYEVDVSNNEAFLYFDATWVAWAQLTSPYTAPFRSLAMGTRTLFANLWVGHAAGYDHAISGSHASQATAASETLAARVTRVAGYLGVPAAEVDVETSYAAPLGRQAEKGRGGADVLDEVASSTMGVLYDTREGHLAMQARNHRYNAASAFTLSVTADEVEADLEPVLDGEGLANQLSVGRVDSDATPILIKDQASKDQEGVNDLGTVQIVTNEDTEAEAYGYAVIARRATPKERITSVKVDVGDLSSSQRALVLAADIGTLFTLANLPTQAPASSVNLFIEGYTESIGMKHFITFNTSRGDLDSPIFIPDDPTFGVLDAGNLIAF